MKLKHVKTITITITWNHWPHFESQEKLQLNYSYGKISLVVESMCGTDRTAFQLQYITLWSELIQKTSNILVFVTKLMDCNALNWRSVYERSAYTGLKDDYYDDDDDWWWSAMASPYRPGWYTWCGYQLPLNYTMYAYHIFCWTLAPPVIMLL